MSRPDGPQQHPQHPDSAEPERSFEVSCGVSSCDSGNMDGRKVPRADNHRNCCRSNSAPRISCAAIGRVEGTVRDDLAADGGVKVARGRGNRTGVPFRPSNQPDPDRFGCGELSDIYLLFQERKWL